MNNNFHRVVEVLNKTNDGRDLHDLHRQLCRIAIVEELSPQGEIAFKTMEKEVLAGTYDKYAPIAI